MLDFPASPTLGQVFKEAANSPTRHIYDGTGWQIYAGLGEPRLIDAGTATASAFVFKLEPEFSSFRLEMSDIYTPSGGMFGIQYCSDNGVTFIDAIGYYHYVITYTIGTSAVSRIVPTLTDDNSRLIYFTGMAPGGYINRLNVDVNRGVGTGYPMVLWQISGHAAMAGSGLCANGAPITHIRVIGMSNPYGTYHSLTAQWQWWGY